MISSATGITTAAASAEPSAESSPNRPSRAARLMAATGTSAGDLEKGLDFGAALAFDMVKGVAVRTLPHGAEVGPAIDLAKETFIEQKCTTETIQSTLDSPPGTVGVLETCLDYGARLFCGVAQITVTHAAGPVAGPVLSAAMSRGENFFVEKISTKENIAKVGEVLGRALDRVSKATSASQETLATIQDLSMIVDMGELPFAVTTSTDI